MAADGASDHASLVTAMSSQEEEEECELELQVIIVGGGFSGLVAANSVLEHGAVGVLVLDKSSRLGGCAKEFHGCGDIAGSRSPELLDAELTKRSVRRPDLADLLQRSCMADSEWLAQQVGLSCNGTVQVGTLEQPRLKQQTGSAVVQALIAALETSPAARVVLSARVTQLLIDSQGACVGCRYVHGNGIQEARGPVVLCTGGYGADFSASSVLARFRPDLLHVPTACSSHCTGDGIRLGQAVGARVADLDWVRMHPTGLVKPDDQDAKVKLLGADALRSAGALLVNQEGDRFCDELGQDCEVACSMWKEKVPIRLLLNGSAADQVVPLCKEYVRRGLMRFYESGDALARGIGIPLSKLEATHEAHFQAARAAKGGLEGDSPDEASKTRFVNPLPGRAVRGEPFYVAVVTPVIHSCIGGLDVSAEASVLDGVGKSLAGLFAAGEVVGSACWHAYAGDGDWLESAALGRVAGVAAAEHCRQGGGRVAAEQISALPSSRAEGERHLFTGSRQLAAQVGRRVEEVTAAPDVRTRVAQGQLNRLLESRLTVKVLQGALAEAHAAGSGDMTKAVEALRRRLCSEAAADLSGPAVRVRVKDRTDSVPTSSRCAPLPDAGGQSAKLPLACVHCRLPVTVEVCRGGGALVEMQDVAAPEEDGEHAYATLLYGNKTEYFLGALVIGWSLKATDANTDRLLLHTDDVPALFLQTLERFWTLRVVEYLEGSPKLFKKFNQSRFKAVFTKLQALSCTDYAKVLMLDLDMLVRSSLRDLFKLRAPAALKRSSGKEQPKHGGTFCAKDMWRTMGDDMCSGINAGVMLLQPDERVYQRMVQEIQTELHPEHLGTYGPEQDYLARFYSTFIVGEWTHIHAKYNYQLALPDDYVSSAHRQLDLSRDVVVAHYSGRAVKPWKAEGGGELGYDGVVSLLHDDSVRSSYGEERQGNSGPQRGNNKGEAAAQTGPRERVMDGVVVKEQGGFGALSEGVKALMWEWVLAFRACARELARAGVDVTSVVAEVEDR